MWSRSSWTIQLHWCHIRGHKYGLHADFGAFSCQHHVSYGRTDDTRSSKKLVTEWQCMLQAWSYKVNLLKELERVNWQSEFIIRDWCFSLMSLWYLWSIMKSLEALYINRCTVLWNRDPLWVSKSKWFCYIGFLLPYHTFLLVSIPVTFYSLFAVLRVLWHDYTVMWCTLVWKCLWRSLSLDIFCKVLMFLVHTIMLWCYGFWFG